MTSPLIPSAFGGRNPQPVTAFNPRPGQPLFGARDKGEGKGDRFESSAPHAGLLSEDAQHKLWQMKVRMRRKYHRIMQAIRDFFDGDGGSGGGGGGGGDRYFDEHGRELIPIRVRAGHGRRNYFA